LSAGDNVALDGWLSLLGALMGIQEEEDVLYHKEMQKPEEAECKWRRSGGERNAELEEDVVVPMPTRQLQRKTITAGMADTTLTTVSKGKDVVIVRHLRILLEKLKRRKI
jgi:hypothetical protein